MRYLLSALNTPERQVGKVKFDWWIVQWWIKRLELRLEMLLCLSQVPIAQLISACRHGRAEMTITDGLHQEINPENIVSSYCKLNKSTGAPVFFRQNSTDISNFSSIKNHVAGNGDNIFGTELRDMKQ